MTDWGSLRHAYGSASDVPALLVAAQARPDDREVWADLWSRLCHQGTTCSASYPALPALTAMAAGRPAAGYVEPLALAAAIVASTGWRKGLPGVRHEYLDEMSALRDMAERNLSLAGEDGEFVYALQALMAFEGVFPWSRSLQALADEELTLECPDCSEYLTVSFESVPPMTTALDDDLPVTAVAASDADRLEGAAARMHALATRHGREHVATTMLFLLGTALCPACGATVDLPSALGS